MAKYIGIAIILLVFSLIVAAVVKSVGIKGAIIVCGGAIIMTALLVFAAWLIAS
jgi:hypothetical protein